MPHMNPLTSADKHRTPLQEELVACSATGFPVRPAEVSGFARAPWTRRCAFGTGRAHVFGFCSLAEAVHRGIVTQQLSTDRVGVEVL